MIPKKNFRFFHVFANIVDKIPFLIITNPNLGMNDKRDEKFHKIKNLKMILNIGIHL